MHGIGCHRQLLQQTSGHCCGFSTLGRISRRSARCKGRRSGIITKELRATVIDLHTCRQLGAGVERRWLLVQASINNGNTSADSSRTRTDGASSNGSRSPVLILPGFLSNNTTAEQSQYKELADNLLSLGHPAAEILPAKTWDWVPTLSGGSFKWYIERLAAAVRRLADRYNSQVSLVGISAGGWLARLALGDVPYHGSVYGLAPKVHTLVTCGTPHQSLEAYPFGRAEEAWICDLSKEVCTQIRTSLEYANHYYPDAESLKPTNIICVVGNAVTGEQFDYARMGLQIITGRTPLTIANDKWFVQSAYVASCGEANVEGDGVCPVQTATIPGAQTLVLPNVWHNQEPGKLWYGSMEVVQQWDKYLP